MLKRKSDKFNVKTFTKLSRNVGTVNVTKDLNADCRWAWVFVNINPQIMFPIWTLF